MLTGVFELQVPRGLAYVTQDMTKTVDSRIHLARSAQETWRLRCNFELEQHIAALTKRRLTLVQQQTAEEGTQEEQTQRLVRCELVGEHLGGITMGAVTSKDLVSEISSTFFTHRFDEDHGATFAVEMVKVMLNVHISGNQWCVPETATSCFLCTQVRVAVKVPGVGRLIEMQLERQLRTSHAAFPQHADAWVSAQLERARAKESPPSSPELELRVLPEREVVMPVALPQRFAPPSSAAPRLSRCQLVASFLLGWAFQGLRRHRILDPSPGSDGQPVVVKVSPRSARLLLLCGCASVHQDEIVE